MPSKQEHFVSYTCCKTHLPILAGEVWGEEQPERCEAVLITEDGLVLRGLYDGHGRLAGRDIRPFIDRGGKVVLASYYDGESWEELGPSHPDPGLGFFHDNAFLDTVYGHNGFVDFETYRQAYFVYDAAIGGMQRIVQQMRSFSLPVAA